MISLYSRKTETDLTIRKKESMDKYVDLIQWGRKNPTKAWRRTFLFVRNGIMSLKTVKPMLKLWQGLLSRK